MCLGFRAWLSVLLGCWADGGWPGLWAVLGCWVGLGCWAVKLRLQAAGLFVGLLGCSAVGLLCFC